MCINLLLQIFLFDNNYILCKTFHHKVHLDKLKLSYPTHLNKKTLKINNN